jgi:UDP-glucose 4-epimerase
MEDPYSDFYGGPVLTFALLASLRDLQPECAFINISSAAVYGNPSELPVKEGAPIRPISSYGFHKWQSEIICQEYASLWGIRTASARIFSAYGPGLHRQVIWDIIYKILTQPEVLLQGTGQESRDFIHVQDIAQGVNVIVNNASMKGEAYNLASGSETKIKDLATLIQARLNAQVEIKFSGELPAGTPINWKADIQKINVLGFSPQMTLEKGINDFIEWARREIGG